MDYLAEGDYRRIAHQCGDLNTGPSHESLGATLALTTVDIQPAEIGGAAEVATVGQMRGLDVDE